MFFNTKKITPSYSCINAIRLTRFQPHKHRQSWEKKFKKGAEVIWVTDIWLGFIVCQARYKTVVLGLEKFLKLEVNCIFLWGFHAQIVTTELRVSELFSSCLVSRDYLEIWLQANSTWMEFIRRSLSYMIL